MSGALSGAPLPRFYIHSGPALDHSWLSCADGYNALLRSAHGRFMAEMGLHAGLARHPQRSRDPNENDLLYFVALFEYTSFKLGTIAALRSPCPPLDNLPAAPTDISTLNSRPHRRIAGACKVSKADLGHEPYKLTHRSRLATRARTIAACETACAAESGCISFAWFTRATPPTFRGTTSRCWLSSTCSAPDCCQNVFTSYVSSRVPTSTSDAKLPARLLLSHEERMRAASEALQALPEWQRHGGRDHLFSSVAFNHPTPLATRLGPQLAHSLRCAMAGRYKSFPIGYQRDKRSAVGVCTVEIPFTPPDAASSLQAALAPVSSASARTTLLYFAGSLDVCCYGKVVRCAVGKLLIASQSVSDVLIRPHGSVESSACLRSTMHKIQKSGINGSTRGIVRQHGRRLAGGGNASVAGPTAYSHGGLLTDRVLRRTALEMSRAVFCLIVAGDSAITDRLYTAVAAGCIPVIVADELRGAFPSTVPWESFWVRVSMNGFARHPEHVLDLLRGMEPSAIRRLQQELAAHRADVLYDAPGSRVASNFLRELAVRCLQILRTGSVQPSERGRLWVSRCLKANGTLSEQESED